MTKDIVNNSQGQNWDLSQDLNTIVNRNGYKVAFVNEINHTKGGTLQECNFQDSGLTYTVDNRLDCAKVINYDMNNIVNIHNINSSNYQSFSLESQVPTADHWGTGNSGDCITVTHGVEHNPTVDPRGQGLNPSMTGHYHTLNHHNVSNVKVYKVDFTNWAFYCPDKNSIDHIVFIHNVGDCQYGGFYYLVQYLQDMSVFVYDCLFIPAGELQIVYSLQMLLNFVKLDGVKHGNIVTGDEQQHAKITYQEYMKESEILTRQGMSLQKYWLHIIDEIISRESHSEDGQVSDPIYDINLVCHDYHSHNDNTVVIHDRHGRQSIPDMIDLPAMLVSVTGVS